MKDAKTSSTHDGWFSNTAALKTVAPLANGAAAKAFLTNAGDTTLAAKTQYDWSQTIYDRSSQDGPVVLAIGENDHEGEGSGRARVVVSTIYSVTKGLKTSNLTADEDVYLGGYPVTAYSGTSYPGTLIFGVTPPTGTKEITYNVFANAQGTPQTWEDLDDVNEDGTADPFIHHFHFGDSTISTCNALDDGATKSVYVYFEYFDENDGSLGTEYVILVLSNQTFK